MKETNASSHTHQQANARVPGAIQPVQRKDTATHADAQTEDVKTTSGPGNAAQLQAIANAFGGGSPSKPPVQRQENKTGLPDNLKSGVENLSGLSMDDVRVHYNSSKPAQLQAHAYAQGTDIHMAPGQEKHLAHEAWHVVQQKQGRVQPTKQLKGQTPVNDDAGLEKEADVMGAKALSMSSGVAQKQVIAGNTAAPVVQRVLNDDQLEAILSAIRGLLANDNNGLLGQVRAAYTAASDSDEIGTINNKALENILARIDALAIDKRGRLALAMNQDFLSDLIILADKISMPGLLQAVSNHLKSDITGDFILSSAEDVGQIKAAFPAVQYNPEALFTEAEVMALLKGNGTLAEKQAKTNEAINKKRMAIFNSTYNPPEDIALSDMPAPGETPGTIKENVIGSLVIPFWDRKRDTETQEEFNERAKKWEDRRWEESNTDELTKGTFVFIANDQPAAHEYLIKSNHNKYHVPRNAVEPGKQPEIKSLAQIPIYKENGPSPDDISQGTLGDCYALAALASVAKSRPGIIRDMIRDMGDDTVSIRFFNKSNDNPPKFTPVWTKVDKRFYVDPDTKQPVYAKGNKALWPLLVEKAYAVFKGKAHGYAALSGGLSSNTFEQVVGKQAHKKDLATNAVEGALGTKQYSEQAEEYYREITEGLANGKMFAAGTKAWGSGGTGMSGGENTDMIPGLASTHAYSVLGAKVVDGHKYIVLRNPWGRFGRKYDKPYLASLRGLPEMTTEAQDSGTFDLELSDLTRYFKSLYEV